MMAFATILECRVLRELTLNSQPELGWDAPLVGRNHKDLFFTLPALVKIAAIVPREHFRGAFDFYALGLEIFVDVHICLDIDGISQQF